MAMSTAVRCGNCKADHESAAEVRECYGAPQAPASIKDVHQGGGVAKLAPVETAPEFSLDEGYYTVVMDGVGHRTFRVSTVKSGGLAGRRIISYLMGSDNTSDYQGCGFVTQDGVKFWRRFAGESLLTYAVEVLLDGPTKAQKDYSLHSGNCYVCGRMLTDPTSVELGIGPVCRGDA